MNKFLKVYKSVGETPLEVIDSLRITHPELKDEKMAYAGRLDPMAHGELVILIGDECKNRDYYQGLDKEYYFKILLGVSTDTQDILGKITKTAETYQNKSVVKCITDFQGEYDQALPVYSSYRVKGKPLFWWAKENKLDEIEIPSKPVEIYELEIVKELQIQKSELREIIPERINKVQGDFRHEEILKTWNNFFDAAPDTYEVIEVRAKVGSGTYIRGLVRDIGERANTPMLALEIERREVFLL